MTLKAKEKSVYFALISNSMTAYASVKLHAIYKWFILFFARLGLHWEQTVFALIILSLISHFFHLHGDLIAALFVILEQE